MRQFEPTIKGTVVVSKRTVLGDAGYEHRPGYNRHYRRKVESIDRRYQRRQKKWGEKRAEAWLDDTLRTANL